MCCILFCGTGMAEPLLISSPEPEHRHNEVTYSMTSLLDIVPTLLDWFNISYPHENEVKPILTGKSLLPLLVKGNFINRLNLSQHKFRRATKNLCLIPIFICCNRFISLTADCITYARQHVISLYTQSLHMTQGLCLLVTATMRSPCTIPWEQYAPSGTSWYTTLTTRCLSQLIKISIFLHHFRSVIKAQCKLVI